MHFYIYYNIIFRPNTLCSYFLFLVVSAQGLIAKDKTGLSSLRIRVSLQVMVCLADCDLMTAVM